MAFNDLKTEGGACSGARDAQGLMAAYNKQVKRNPAMISSSCMRLWVLVASQSLQAPMTAIRRNVQVMMGILPVALFSNGHTFYVQHLQDRLDDGLSPYAVHATFQYGVCPPFLMNSSTSIRAL